MGKKAGFGGIGLLVTLVTVAVIGIVAWRIYTSAEHSNSQQSDQNAGYLVIDAWSVRLKPVEGLIGLRATNRNSQIPQVDEMMLVTDDMLKLDKACSGEAEGSRPLGALVRTQTQIEQSGNKQLLLLLRTCLLVQPRHRDRKASGG